MLSQEPLQCMIFKALSGSEATSLILYIQVTFVLFYEEKNDKFIKTFGIKLLSKTPNLIKGGQ